MEAKELMIGDLVHHKKRNALCRVTAVGDNCIWMEMFTEIPVSYNTWVVITDFEPICLTKEILGANGWQCDEAYAILHLDNNLYLEYRFHENRLTKMFDGIDERDNHSHTYEICGRLDGLDNVHKFQNALRQFGLKELADNIKIE